MSSNNSALRQLALESQQRFSEKRLQDALSLIQQCSSIQNKELDSRNALKLQHNLSLLQYMVGSQAVTDETGNTQDAPRRLLEELVRMRKVIEDKLSQQETDNATNSVESTPPSPSRNLFEDADLHVVSLNQAALLMHLKQFGSALIILESMFQNIEPLDEALVLRVCWMLLELYVGPLHSPEKAVPVFTFVEKNFADRIKHDAQNMNSRSIENIAYMLTFYRTRLNLLTAQLKASSLSNMESFSVSPILSPFFKAQLSFLRFQPAAALKELSQAAANGASNGGAQNPMNATMYFNNLACVHFQMNKYSLSSFYLTRALQENDKANAAIGKSVRMFTRSRRSEILYNLGLQLLLTQKPEQAFRCFQESSLQFVRDPKLWLRMTECCVMVHLQKVDEKKRQTLKLNGLYQHTVGKKSLRRVVLPMSQPLERLVVKDATETQDKNSNSATPVLRESQFSLYGSASLEYGSRCVRNVLILVSAHDFHGSADEQNALRQSALANGSFIALCCDNPVVALSHAKELLSIETCPENIRLLASMYAAEALAMLSRPAEAAEYMQPTKLGLGEQSTLSINFSLDPSQPANLNAKHVLFLNLAIVHILKDELPLAQQCVQQAMMVQSSPQLLLTLIYLYLRQGNTGAALQILKTQNGTFVTE